MDLSLKSTESKIFAGVIIFLLFLYAFGYSPENSPQENVQEGWDNLVEIIGDTTGGGGGTPPAEDETPEDEPSWHQEEFNLPSEDTIIDNGGFGETEITFSGLPSFSPGGEGNVQISFYHAWTVSDADEAALPCDPGVLWHVKDSTGTIIYYSIEPMPVDGTDPLVGTWDGYNPWVVFFGNNCVSDVYHTYSILISYFS